MAMPIIAADGERSTLGALWDTTRMRLLVALANERSVSAAARAIGVTQSTASEHVRVLEVAMGQPLIERFGRGSRLTDAGRVLAVRASEALAALAAGEDEIANLAGLQSGRVVLAASWAPGVYLLPDTLGCFQHEYPRVSIELEVSSRPTSSSASSAAACSSRSSAPCRTTSASWCIRSPRTRS